MVLHISSPEFEYSATIPKRFTCDGENLSPLLRIEAVPNNAKSLALIMDDPDAPSSTFTHWVVFNINPSTAIIEEDLIPTGAILGTNDFNKLDYGGPCPPSGKHRYFFKLFALDTMLDLKPGATKEDVKQAMQSHIIETAELMGTYQRK